MKRRILIAVLALGTVGGYAAGFASLGRCGKWRREAFERHVAKVCVDAARGAGAEAPDPGPPPRGRRGW